MGTYSRQTTHSIGLMSFPRVHFFQKRIKYFCDRTAKAIHAENRRKFEQSENVGKLLDCSRIQVNVYGNLQETLNSNRLADKLNSTDMSENATTESHEVTVVAIRVDGESLELTLEQDLKHFESLLIDVIYVEVACDNKQLNRTLEMQQKVTDVLLQTLPDIDAKKQLVVCLVNLPKRQCHKHNIQSNDTHSKCNNQNGGQESVDDTQHNGSQRTPSCTATYKANISKPSSPKSILPFALCECKDNSSLNTSDETIDPLLNVKVSHPVNPSSPRIELQEKGTESPSETEKYVLASEFSLSAAISNSIEEELFLALGMAEEALKDAKSQTDKQAVIDEKVSTVEKLLFESKGLYSQGNSKLCEDRKMEHENTPKVPDDLIHQILRLDNVIGCGTIYGKLTVHVQGTNVDKTELRMIIEKLLKSYQWEHEGLLIQTITKITYRTL